MNKRYPIPFNRNYTITKSGEVYNPENKLIKPFSSNGYKQVCIKPEDGSRRKIFGVHQLMAMTFIENYSPDCVTHHKDGDKTNNKLENLECKSRSEHSRQHANYIPLWKHIVYYGPHNKGQYTSTNPETVRKRENARLKRESKQINIDDIIVKK